MASSSNKLPKRRRTTAKKVKGALSKARDGGAPTIRRASGQAWEGVEQGLGAIDETARRAHEVSRKASKTVVAYTKKKPIKALAIAAASGALLHAALNIFRPSRNKQADARNR